MYKHYYGIIYGISLYILHMFMYYSIMFKAGSYSRIIHNTYCLCIIYFLLALQTASGFQAVDPAHAYPES